MRPKREGRLEGRAASRAANVSCECIEFEVQGFIDALRGQWVPWVDGVDRRESAKAFVKTWLPASMRRAASDLRQLC